MLAMDVTQIPQRRVILDGTAHYYRNGWFSNKWSPIYAKLWSDSTLEWFESASSTKPLHSIVLNTLIPYICIGSQVRKIPTKKPKIEATWSRDFLMAVASDPKASTVYWFYFDNADTIKRWVSAMTQTFPKLSAPMESEKTMDHFFDETFNNFGLGHHFWPMKPLDDFSIDSDLDTEHPSVHVMGDKDKVHVSQVGDTTSITLRTGTDRGTQELGSGFAPMPQV